MSGLSKGNKISKGTPKLSEIPQEFSCFYDHLEGWFEAPDPETGEVSWRRQRAPLCDNAYFMAIDAEWFASGGRNVVLSYQVATASRHGTANIIKYVRDGCRLSLPEIVELGLKSVHQGQIPEDLRGSLTRIILISHNIAAEWSVLADRDEPYLTKRLALVRKSPITDGHAIKLTLDKKFPVDVVFYDTMLLAPASHLSLAKLSELIVDEDDNDGASEGDNGGDVGGKIPIKQVEIEHMDRFLRDDPERYEAYALRDSEVCLRLFFVLQDALNRLAFGKFERLFRTLASAGVKGFLSDSGDWFMDYLVLLGLRPIKVTNKGLDEPTKTELAAINRRKIIALSEDQIMALNKRELQHLITNRHLEFDTFKALENLTKGGLTALTKKEYNALNKEKNKAIKEKGREAREKKKRAIYEKKAKIARKFIEPYQLIRRAYHGGRNESYMRGRTEDFKGTRDRVWIDIDLSGAYPSAMALCPKIDVHGKVKHLPLRYEISDDTRTKMSQEGLSPDLIDGACKALNISLAEFDQYLSDKPRAKARLIRQYAAVIDNSLIHRWQRMSHKSARWNPESYLIPGFARVRFTFDKKTTFPCLSVGHYRYGLLYPLSGETVATAAEILLALACGAKIEALTSVELPIAKDKDSKRPDCFFQHHLSEILTERQRYKDQVETDPSAEVFERLLKEFANSFYGKFAQAINTRNVFRPSTGEMVALGPSELSEPCVAALTTGMIRAVLSSLMIAIDKRNKEKQYKGQAPVLSATTDGILFGVPRPIGCDIEKEYYIKKDGIPFLDNKSDAGKKALAVNTLFERFECKDILERFEELLPVRQLMYARERLTEKPDYLEVKHLVDKVISVKTRGQIGQLNSDHVPLLARFGHKPPLSELLDDPEEYKRIMAAGGTVRNNEDAEWLLEQLERVENGRDGIDTYTFITLTPFRKMLQSEGSIDLTKQVRQQKVNTDFDWKRKIVAVDSPLTEPYKDVAEMVTYRRQAEGLRRSGRVARTEQILHRVELKGRTFRYRDGEAATLVRSFLRGLTQKHISVQGKLRYIKIVEHVNAAWKDCEATPKAKVWTETDCGNAKRAKWETGVMLPTPMATSLLESLCQRIKVDYDETYQLIFVSPEYRDENVALVKAVVRAILMAPHAGFEPFRTLFFDGKLPSRTELLAAFRPVLTESLLEECAHGRFEPGTRFPGDREKLTQLLRRCGLPGNVAQKCARLLAPPSPSGSKPRRNPAQIRCLENFVSALQLRDISVKDIKSDQIMDRLKRFGLSRRRYYNASKGVFTPNSLTNTPENKKQIETMAKALRLDPVPFLDVLLDY